MKVADIQKIAQKVKNNIGEVMVGKQEITDLLLVALLSSGHVLLEDVPGMGKTLLAKAMAKSLRCTYRRIQFTPDLLPTDLSGIHFYNQQMGEFQFRPGPIFSHILLADEINRATPRTQSSLLECMEERQVTVDGETKCLERPFMVIATQNPVENQGTFPLPEAQLDRFLLKVRLGYPTREEGLEIMRRFKQGNPLELLESVAEAEEIRAAQDGYSAVHVSHDLLGYMLSIAEKTREHADIVLGISPRGSQALLKAVQAYAVLQGRGYVVPDDVKKLAKPVLAHRLVLRSMQRLKENQAEAVLEQIIGQIPVPSEEKLAKEQVN